jgi:protein-L-isoaspartate(D-aspartate) O-methyltransferase
MINLSDQSEQARIQLVQHLCATGNVHSERLAQAFLAIKREAFVTQFFEQEGFVWKVRTMEQYPASDWINAIYRDEPLVTWVDAQNRVGSSSSAPTAMAMMLEALDLQPGHRVLEIGTGSGYNAALLAFLVGDPCLVTTIEVKETLALSAKKALETNVGPISVHIGNGYDGVPSSAPYDRIIAAASAPTIPRSWFDQLKPHGRLVMDLQGSLHKSSFLVLEKTDAESVYGQFDPRALYFMPMRAGLPAASPVKHLLQQPIVQQIVLENDATTNTLFDNASLHWFLQWAVPGITLTKAKMKGKDGTRQVPLVTFVDPEEKTIIQFALRDGKWFGNERGSGGLWETISQATQEWYAYGCPDQTAYHVEWSPQDACFQLLYEQEGVRRVFDLR